MHIDCALIYIAWLHRTDGSMQINGCLFRFGAHSDNVNMLVESAPVSFNYSCYTESYIKSYTESPNIIICSFHSSRDSIYKTICKIQYPFQSVHLIARITSSQYSIVVCSVHNDDLSKDFKYIFYTPNMRKFNCAEKPNLATGLNCRKISAGLHILCLPAISSFDRFPIFKCFT
jgi:hypothetical protein